MPLYALVSSNENLESLVVWGGTGLAESGNLSGFLVIVFFIGKFPRPIPKAIPEILGFDIKNCNFHFMWIYFCYFTLRKCSC